MPASLVQSPDGRETQGDLDFRAEDRRAATPARQVNPLRSAQSVRVPHKVVRRALTRLVETVFGSPPGLEVTPMIRYDAGTTNPALLNRLCDWRDQEAWVDFVTRYDPVIRLACRRYRLSAENADELSQRVWIDLARRMRTFRYDPGKTFRGWLRRLCQSRAIDLLRKENADAVLWLEDQPGESLSQEATPEIEAEEDAAGERPLLLHLAEEVQDAVRRRVDERTWQVFWNVAVLGQSVREASEAAGLSYYAAFAAQKRVRQMLREEGQRHLAERWVHDPGVGQAGD